MQLSIIALPYPSINQPVRKDSDRLHGGSACSRVRILILIAASSASSVSCGRLTFQRRHLCAGKFRSKHFLQHCDFQTSSSFSLSLPIIQIPLCLGKPHSSVRSCQVFLSRPCATHNHGSFHPQTSSKWSHERSWSFSWPCTTSLTRKPSESP
jgi:hypothetical protein